MRNFTLLIIFSILFSPISSFSQTDIVGGEDASIVDYPWQAAMLGESWFGGTSAYCGASVINEYWVLTAAHCMSGENANSTYVRVGNSNSYAQGGQTYDVAEIISHPNYNGNTMNNDIALIRLSSPIQFSNAVQPILLICDQQVDLGAEDPGAMSWITGWGEDEGTANDPNQLQVVDIPIIGWSNQLNYGANQIDDDMIMAGYIEGGYDSCQGDSGGPMVVRDVNDTEWLQVGIVSWGYGCADEGSPGVYARVSYFLDWICENTGGAVCANEQTFCNSDIVYGCTDSTAENYNPDATTDNGSCDYPCDNTISLELTLDCYGEEISWELVNENGNIIESVELDTYPGGNPKDGEEMEDGGSTQEQEICLSEGCYTFTITDSYGDGVTGSEWSCGVDGTPFSITDENGNILFIETDPAFGDCEVGGQEGPCSASYSFCITIGDPVDGCTDPNASNFDPNANTDDGSCIYEGCTDEDACNYNPDATIDNNSCEYTSCAGCTDDNYLEYDESATIDDGSCETLIILGCTDSNADNYNPNATQDDGSCDYPWEPCDIVQWSESFESYDDSNIDPQSSEWVGWDNINSGVDVTDDFGFSSNQSILVEEDDDLVHLFDGINSGNGEIIFWMYIPSNGGAGAYYNILHEYNGQNSVWAHQITFASADSGDQSVLDAAGYAAVTFDAIYDTWVEVRQEIDLDNDYTTLYYNGEVLYSWQFSQDAGGEQQLNILDAINFHGYDCDGNCIPIAYYDNIEMCGDFKVNVFGCTDPDALNYNQYATVDDGSCEYDTSSLEEFSNLEVNIFPNPSNGLFNMVLNENLTNFEIEIINILGQIVYNESVDNYTINTNKKIDVKLVKGTYIINVNNKEQTIQVPIIIE